MKITVERKRKTEDGIIGTLTLDSNPFTCFTVERLERAIPVGLYPVVIDYSPRFNALMPHVRVAVRDQAAGGDAGIRIHPANFPGQLEGCIAVGDKEEPDAVDNSRVTFNILFKLLEDATDITLEVKESYT